MGSKISKSNPNHKQIWERVEVIHGEVRQHLFEIEAQFGFCNADIFRKKYFKEEIPQDEDLLSLFKNFIELKSITLKPKLVQKLQAIEKHLNEFLGKRKVYPVEFNQLLVNKLASYWRDKKEFQPNTISKNFKFLRQFLNHLHNEEILTSSKYRRLQYPKEVETFAVVLSREEVIQLIKYQPETTSLTRVKDLFLILTFTGLRFSDAIRISKSWVKGEFLVVNTQKTGERVSVPIHPKLKELLGAYGYDVKALKISNQKFNDYIKILCEKAEINDMVEVVRYQKGNKVYQSIPKFQLISSHTGRRTFITNSILAGIPLPIIQGITGHKKLSTLQKYIKTSEKDSSIELMKLASYFS